MGFDAIVTHSSECTLTHPWKRARVKEFNVIGLLKHLAKDVWG